MIAFCIQVKKDFFFQSNITSTNHLFFLLSLNFDEPPFLDSMSKTETKCTPEGTHTSRLSLGDWTFGNGIENFEKLLSIFFRLTLKG